MPVGSEDELIDTISNYPPFSRSATAGNFHISHLASGHLLRLMRTKYHKIISLVTIFGYLFY